MKAQFSHVHWLRVLLTSVLVVILVVIFNIVFVVAWSTFVLQLVLTVGGAVWVARKVESGAPLHGFLIGLVVALIFFPLSLGFRYPALVMLGGFVLTVAAGWLGGVLGSRGRETS